MQAVEAYIAEARSVRSYIRAHAHDFAGYLPIHPLVGFLVVG
jgi:hypothetical protein